jgi:hypothetical protein
MQAATVFLNSLATTISRAAASSPGSSSSASPSKSLTILTNPAADATSPAALQTWTHAQPSGQDAKATIHSNEGYPATQLQMTPLGSQQTGLQQVPSIPQLPLLWQGSAPVAHLSSRAGTPTAGYYTPMSTSRVGTPTGYSEASLSPFSSAAPPQLPAGLPSPQRSTIYQPLHHLAGPDGPPAQAATMMQTSAGIAVPSRPHSAPPTTGAYMMPAAAPAMQQTHQLPSAAPGSQQMALLHECNSIMQQFAPVMSASGATGAGEAAGSLPADAVQHLEMLQARLAALLHRGPEMGIVSTAAQAPTAAASSSAPVPPAATAAGSSVQGYYTSYAQQSSGQGHQGQVPQSGTSFTMPG